MSTAVFATVLKMSMAATLCAVIILPIKYLLQFIGCPKRMLFFLWAVIAFRLICPALPESDLNPLNVSVYNSENTAPASNILREERLPAFSYNSENETKSENYPIFVWICGMALTAGVGVLSYIKLRVKLKYAVKTEDNIYVSNRIASPFVLGVIKPKIYIPENVPHENLDSVIVHERVHIRRKDYLMKIFAYAILTVHWFNPFAWLMFNLFSDDIELLCDEFALRILGEENKKRYLNSLLDFAVRDNTPFQVVHFSANFAKRRVKSLIKSKEPSRGKTAFTAVCITFLSITFATAAKEKDGTIVQNTQAFHEVETSESVSQKAEEVTTKADYTLRGATAAKNEDFTVEKTEISEETPEDELFEEETVDFALSEKTYAGKILKENADIVNLRTDYTIKRYSGENNLTGNIESVKPDSDGNISVCFDVNAANTADVIFRDGQTGEEVGNFGILADNENTYSFTGFDKEKTYSVEIRGKTQGDWNIEGSYIVY